MCLETLDTAQVCGWLPAMGSFQVTRTQGTPWLHLSLESSWWGVGHPYAPTQLSWDCVQTWSPRKKWPVKGRAGKAERLPVSSGASGCLCPSTRAPMGWPSPTEAKGGSRLLFFFSNEEKFCNSAFNFLAICLERVFLKNSQWDFWHAGSLWWLLGAAPLLNDNSCREWNYVQSD